jgi:hypothetical protein
MATSSQLTLYRKVVNISHEYVGPAADRFVSRQIKNHLNKSPEQLRKQDLAKLIDWISLAMALLIEDEKMIKEYVESLKQLASNSKA